MQAESVAQDFDPMIEDLKSGRPPRSPRQLLESVSRLPRRQQDKISDIPSSVLPSLADALGVSIEQIIGLPAPKGGKRGPKSRLEMQFEELQRLPKSEQELAAQVLGRLLAGAR